MSVALLDSYLEDFWAAYAAQDVAAAIIAQDALFRGITDWDVEPRWERSPRILRNTSAFLYALQRVTTWARAQGVPMRRLHSVHDWIGLVDAPGSRPNMRSQLGRRCAACGRPAATCMCEAGPLVENPAPPVMYGHCHSCGSDDVLLPGVDGSNCIDCIRDSLRALLRDPEWWMRHDAIQQDLRDLYDLELSPPVKNPSSGVLPGTWWHDDRYGDRAKVKLVVSGTVYYENYPRNGGGSWTTRQPIAAFLRTHTPDDSAPAQ